MLLSEGLITQAQLDAALKAQAERGLPIGQLLVEDGAVTEAVLMGALARQLGLEFVDLAEYPIDRGAVALLPEAMARRLLALPITWADDRLQVALADPGNVLAIDDLRAVTGAEIQVVVATRTQLAEAIDRRVATLPTVYGEKVVMRILDKTQARLSLEDLGFHPAVLPRFEACFRKPYGTVLVTGPTGSGKSTTLYATLNVLNSTDKNVITVEDPVEYRLPGVNQVQVNPKAGLTFASALRSILRSDPDIVHVGENRDRETATIAIEASLTGHLVLSTLHTNDAASTPMRLVEMGVEPFLVVSALDCVVAQRLARKLCDRCREEYEPTHAELTEAGWPAALLKSEGAPTLHRP